jgi:putative membrane protein
MKLTTCRAIVFISCATVAVAQPPTQRPTRPQTTTPDYPRPDASNSQTRETSDNQFVTKAAQGGLAEVKLGELAKDKGASQSVKDFGDRMVTDHSAANNELKSLAGNKGVNVPEELTAKDQATYDRLSKLSGDQFDRAYMTTMVKDHQADVAEFRRASQTLSDSDLKAFAAKTLPTLESHLQMARTTERQLGTASKK